MAAKKGTAKSGTKGASKGPAKSAAKGGAKGASKTTSPGSTGASEAADESGRSAPARSNEELSGAALRREMASPTIASVTTMVCLTCGAEQFFDGAVPGNLKCQRCSSTVFRTFDTPTERNEATVAHLEEEARSVQYGDPSPAGTQEDARDLDMGSR